MNWKCFFGHDWKEVGSRTTQEWGEDPKYPISIFTTFLFKCAKCSDLKSKIIFDYSVREDDDDDNDDPPKPPVLSPDDYYESITK